MSKLLKLKEWLTIEEAAKGLSISVGEDVTEADILRLALDGHLTLSVYFVNHARGRPARIEPLGIQHFSNAPSFYEYGPPRYGAIEGEVLLNKKQVLVYEGDIDEPEILKGVWDLLMIGAEKLDVEHAFQMMTGGPDVNLICFGGPMVASPDGTRVFQILDSCKNNTNPVKMPPSASQLPIETREEIARLNAGIAKTLRPSKDEGPSRLDHERSYYPADTLPQDSILVVRVAALRDLEAQLLAEDAQPERPLHPSERKSAGQIIAALAAMAGLDLSTPYAADETLRAVAATYGLELPSSPETVVKFLKAAAERAGKL